MWTVVQRNSAYHPDNRKSHRMHWESLATCNKQMASLLCDPGFSHKFTVATTAAVFFLQIKERQ
jgi:hypothetical protein